MIIDIIVLNIIGELFNDDTVEKVKNYEKIVTSIQF